jgi:hypothetical protein
MSESWGVAVMPFLVSAAALILPGLAVMIAGWGRRVETVLLSPAVSTALIGASALAAPGFRIPWSPLPVIILTAVVAATAFFVRGRGALKTEERSRWPVLLVTAVAFLGAFTALILQFARAFGGPEHIAQRFDNIVHLNTVAYAIDTANASPFHVGATSDIPFYPSTWHALASLVAQVTGTDVPIAVNAANLAVVSVLWPASSLALAAVVFRSRPVALVAAAGVSTATGAFPALFFNWGVLYPNVVGYAVIPAVLASAVLALRPAPPRSRLLGWLLICLLAGGAGLAHPNAFLASLALGVPLIVGMLSVRASELRTRAAIAPVVTVGIGLLLLSALVWLVARTGAAHSQWAPWESRAQAFGEAALLAPRGFDPTIILVILLFAGLVAVVRNPRLLPLAGPFIVAAGLFVLAAGFSTGSSARYWLTNPWYSDPNRLAALLPIAAIPIAVCGAIAIADASAALLRRSERLARLGPALGTIAGVGLLVALATGPNVTIALAQVHEAYASDNPDALLLSPSERALLERLEDEVPADALIAGSPRTGTSLAYALAGRDVVELHVFGSRTPDEALIGKHLRDLHEDPAVCEAVNRLGVDYVLDFGRRDIMDNEADAATYDGVQDLQPSEELVLVDSEGPAARLFRIEGC